MSDFSYETLRGILSRIRDSGRLRDFADAGDNFIVLRHDIEFSMEKAVMMARIERQVGVTSTYFVQIGNDSYNPFSDRSKEILREITGYGHKVGLHYRWGSDPEKEIREQALFLGEQIGARIDRYSTHRPQKTDGYERDIAPGLINAYGSKFFEKTDEPEKASVKYLSDSCYVWRFGFPDAETLQRCARVQVLIHPFQWGTESVEDCREKLMRLLDNGNRENFENEFYYRRG